MQRRADPKRRDLHRARVVATPDGSDRPTFACLRGILVSLALLGAALLAPTVRADDAPGSERAGPEPEGIQWATSLAEGRAAAARDGKLLFLYFGRHSPR
jgi:hypothetical protein